MARLIVRSKLNGINIIKAINKSLNNFLLKYGSGLLKWTREEVDYMDRTRKLMAMFKGYTSRMTLQESMYQGTKEKRTVWVDM